jgi:hypothetical protein
MTRPSRRLTARPAKPGRTWLSVEPLEDRATPATITVTTAEDSLSPMTGISLRQAVGSINLGANLPGVTSTGTYGVDDTILFDSAQVGPAIVLNSGPNPLGALPAVARPLTMTGPGFGALTVSGNNSVRVFDVAASAGAVTIGGLTVANGRSLAVGPDDGNGAGVRAAANLTLTGVRFLNNDASQAGGSPGVNGLGGAIFATRPLALTDSVIEGNTAAVGGGVYAAGVAVTVTGGAFTRNVATQGPGGGLQNDDGQVTITDATFTGNRADDPAAGAGGAIHSTGPAAVLRVRSTTFRANRAEAVGGAVAATHVVEVGALNFVVSVFDGNSAAGAGGAVFYDGGAEPGSSLAVSITTLVNNESGGDGGAVFLANPTGGESLTNVTLTQNAAAGFGGAVYAGPGAGLARLIAVTVARNRAASAGGVGTDSGQAAVFDSILAGNAATQPGGITDADNFVSFGGNVLGFIDPVSASLTRPSDVLGVADPRLGKLPAGFGPIPFLSGSPAIGRGIATGTQPAVPNVTLSAPPTDQDGLDRPSDGAYDAGAFQAQRPAAEPDTYATPFGQPLTVAAPGVLANDEVLEPAYAGNPLTAIDLTQPAAGTGTVTLNPDGSFTYTPPAGFSGTATFTYRAFDQVTASTPTTVTITVSPAGVLTLGPSSLPAGTVGSAYSQAITAAGGAGPVTFRVSAGSLPAGLTLGGDGVLSGTPTAAGTANFTVSATDATGATGSQNYAITVTAVPPAPPVGLFAVGAGAGAAATGAVPQVRVFNADGSFRFDLMPFETDFSGGVRVAVGDVNADGVPDIVCGAGVGGAPRVVVFDGATGRQLFSFFAYPDQDAAGNSNRLGVFVAVGDVTGDGAADVVTGIGSGGGPRVRVFDGRTSGVARDFFAYAPDFLGGVRVAVGDVNADGFADIVTAPGPSGGPDVRLFDGAALTRTNRFTPLKTFDGGMAAGYRGGAFVAVLAAGAAGADADALIVVAPDSFPDFVGTELGAQFGTLPDPNGTAPGGQATASAVSSGPFVSVTAYDAEANTIVPLPAPFGSFPVLSPSADTGVRVAVGVYRGAAGLFVGSGPRTNGFGPTDGGRLQFYAATQNGMIATAPTLDVAGFGASIPQSLYVAGSVPMIVSSSVATTVPPPPVAIVPPTVPPVVPPPVVPPPAVPPPPPLSPPVVPPPPPPAGA